MNCFYKCKKIIFENYNMKKTTKNVNSIKSQKALYNAIMESVTPQIAKLVSEVEEGDKVFDDVKNAETNEDNDVDESALNELFGFGSSVKKPEKALSLENSDDENADLFIAWSAYYISKCGNDAKKGMDAFLKASGDVIKKAPMMIVKGILKLMSGAIKGSVYGVGTIAAVVLSGISMLVRFTVSGVEKAKETLAQLYKIISQGITTFYKNFTSGTEKFVQDSSDKLTVWLGVISGALMACANKISGAVESLGNFFKQVLADAKEKKDGAVLLVKTWLQAKSEAVKTWITETGGEIRKTVIEAWNSMDKKVRNAYDKIAKKLEDWMNDIKELVQEINTKVSDAVDKAKDVVIDKKDKALVWGIQKGVKGLSKNYTEDQVVALVRKCYNESVVPNKMTGNIVINEAYLHAKGTKARVLYERKMARRGKLLK